jgi:hypothetical protein
MFEIASTRQAKELTGSRAQFLNFLTRILQRNKQRLSDWHDAMVAVFPDRDSGCYFSIQPTFHRHHPLVFILAVFHSRKTSNAFQTFLHETTRVKLIGYQTNLKQHHSHFIWSR